MNNNKYPHLTSPIQLGKVTFRNRIFSAPMGATDIFFEIIHNIAQ